MLNAMYVDNEHLVYRVEKISYGDPDSWEISGAFLAFLNVKPPACLASFFPSFLPAVRAPGLWLGTWGTSLEKAVEE